MGAKRMIVTIPEEDKSWLESYSKIQRISVAEAIRQGIGQLKKAQRRRTYQELVERTSGTWQQEDGLAFQEKMRAEWD